MVREENLVTSSEMSASTLSVPPVPNKKASVTVVILVVVNMLNYMDRFTIAGIPLNVQRFYHINDEQMGLLQTMFFVSYTLLSPVAGYFGDRWHRKYIMVIGLLLWICVTLCSSFVPSNLFNVFLVTRCLVGVGEASYSTIAPTIISDLYVGDERVKMLGFFYFAVPIGSGCGYVLGWAVTLLTNQWQWSLRITPILGVFCVILLVYFHRDPPRGQAEGAARMQTTSWLADLRSLMLNPAFLLVSGGFTCSTFILGALTWFGVQLIQLGLNATYDDANAWKAYNVPLIFGCCLFIAGIVGVLLGAYLSRFFRPRYPTADPVICGAAHFFCAPLLLSVLVAPSVNFFLCVVFVFLVQVLLCISWALVSDMTMVSGSVIVSHLAVYFSSLFVV
ncbi:Integral membrane efflux protein efpa [Fasciola gigantica]|uniref:Integral membrane efflux protein efpa n=1 Tax=Fasciola gigantica TaxID=46835 RepID=A0A504YME8_FASGI|nr:Integral membrane efflux protein efpa [Fasciola gigantica]